MEISALLCPRIPTGFLDLPYEIRLQVYRHCLPQGCFFAVSPLLLDRAYRPERAKDAHSYDAARRKSGDASAGLEFEELELEPSEFVYNSLGGDLGYFGLEDEAECHSSEDEGQFGSFNSAKSWTAEPWHSVIPSLLQVSRQVSREALGMLYGGNVFKVILHGKGGHHLKTVFSEATRRKIRHLMLVLRPMGVSYGPGFEPDTALWSSIFPHLATLWIVAEQPVEHDRHWAGHTAMAERKTWIKWLTPVLECLASALSPETTVLVDVDGREGTAKLIHSFLRRGFRQVQTKTGDFIFNRGEFSMESGYWDGYDSTPSSYRDIYEY